jgi:hypothetical protein
LPQGNDTDAFLNLPNFLAVDGGRLDAVQLNLLKLKILSLLHMARQGQIAPFRLHDLYINRETLNPAVDLFNHEGKADPQEELTSLNEMLSKHKLFFVKPEKEFFAPDKQDQLQDAFFTFVTHRLAAHQCVRKIFILGSSVNKRSGKYKVPFVHFDWAKLNSDFDTSQLVYQVGYVLGEFIVGTWGRDGLVRLVRLNGDVERALETAVPAFEARWHAFLREKSLG